MTRRRSIKTRIQETAAFKRGQPFSSGEMARWLGEDTDVVAKACATLRTEQKLETINGRHRKISFASTSKMRLRTQYFDWEKTVVGPREWAR